jgi:hypothetical protein
MRETQAHRNAAFAAMAATPPQRRAYATTIDRRSFVDEP